MAGTKKKATVAEMPKTNGALPRVPITINGKEYFLHYDFNAIARAEELTGLNLFASFDFTHLSVTKFRAMLFASLLREHPDMTLEEAGDLVTIHTLPDITVKLVEAWHGSRPEITKGEGDEGNAAAGAGE